MLTKDTHIAAATTTPQMGRHDPIKALWVAVIDRAIRDLQPDAMHRTPPGKLHRDATRFLESDWGGDVMAFVGLDPAAVRDRINSRTAYSGPQHTRRRVAR